MGGCGEDAAAAVTKSRPTIVVPQRTSADSFFANGLTGLGFSPGPMTLVSGYFSEQGPFSFSQLLAGAMVSPIAAKPGFLMSNGSGKEEKAGDSAEEGKSGESDGGYKRNRPANLAVALPPLTPENVSPLLMVPPGLSPSGLLHSPGFLSPLQSPFGMSHQQALAHVTAQAVFSQSYMQMQAEFQQQLSPAEALPEQSSTPALSETLMTNPPAVEPESSRIESSEVSQSDKKFGHVSGCKPGSDGYNWRKYGQKHVKASECPRSYYKCTHPNCPVKKKVEQSVDGSISSIVYKGHHNHDPPQHNKRRKESFTVDKAVNSQSNSAFASQDWNGMDAANEATRFDSESVNFLETTQQALEQCPSYKDEADEGVIVQGDDDGDEPNAKRRAMDTAQSMKPSTHHTITESKIVVQTRSEVDLLDDGYKWRKYGQKVVKGNPHPRSYYRCTFAGCNVRKHVERSSADPKAVITTYEGKHNHEIPAERYSSHSTGGAVKIRRVGGENPAEMGIGNHQQQEMIPITLHLKEERIAA